MKMIKLFKFNPLSKHLKSIRLLLMAMMLFAGSGQLYANGTANGFEQSPDNFAVTAVITNSGDQTVTYSSPRFRVSGSGWNQPGTFTITVTGKTVSAVSRIGGQIEWYNWGYWGNINFSASGGKAVGTIAGNLNVTKDVYFYYCSSNQTLYYSGSSIASPPAGCSYTPPDIALSSSNPAVAAANLRNGTSNNPVYGFNLAVTTANATINSVAFNNSGTAVYTTDITNYKLYYTGTSSTFATTTLLGTITSGSSFTGLTQALASGSTYYFWITSDIVASPTANRTIIIDAITTGGLTFAAGNKSGTASAGGTQTIKIFPTITTPTSASISSSSAVLGGNITSIGNSNVTERGIYYSTTAGFADGAGTKVSETGTYGTGVFTVNVSGLSVNTRYYYKAFATNTEGTAYTAQGNFHNIKVCGTGLTGTYYNNNNWTAPACGTRTDATISFNYGNGGPGFGSCTNTDNFSVVWTGYIVPLYSETYTFYLNHDDGAVLTIGGTTVVNQSQWLAWGSYHSGTIALVAGQAYTVNLTLSEGGGGANVELRWQSASQANQLIPQSQLFTGVPSCSTTYYSCNGTDLSIMSNWKTNTDCSGSSPSNMDGAADVFIVQAGHSCTFGTSDAVAGTLTVNGTLEPSSGVVISGGGTVNGTGTIKVTKSSTFPAGTSGDRFTSLHQAATVTSAGTYYFNIGGSTYDTYVDANGYVMVAIDFGDGSGNLTQGTSLTTAARGIFNSTVLATLTETAVVRITTSTGLIDVTTTNSTIKSRIQSNTTLHQGTADNTINNDWSGTGAAYLTNDASGTTGAGTSLQQNIFHPAGQANGMTWVPSGSNQREYWNLGEAAAGTSFRIWVKGVATSIGDLVNQYTLTRNLSSLTVDYAGTAAQTMTPTTYNNLTISNTSGTFTALENITVNTTFTTAASTTLDMSTFDLIDDGSIAISHSGTLKTGFNNGADPGLPENKTWGGTVEFTATAGGTRVPYGTYNNLTTKNTAGSTSVTGNTTINGNLTITSGTLDVSANNYALNIAGNFINNSAFTPRSGTVTFNGTTTVSGSATTSFNNVTISGTLTGHATGMNVGGNWVNNGTYTHNSGTVYFNGNTTVSGTSNTTLFKAEINAGKYLTVASGKTVTMDSTFYIRATNPHNMGQLVMTDNTSYLVGGANNKRVYVEVYDTLNNWHYMASPIYNGFKGAQINLLGYYVKRYNEPTLGYVSLAGTDSLRVGLGYTVKYSTSAPSRLIQFKEQLSKLHNGTISVTVTNTAGTDHNGGWNLLGNPYPSAIDWKASSGWNNTYIDPTIYTYDGVLMRYTTYNKNTDVGTNGGTRYIPPMQGFYLFCSDGTPTFKGTGTYSMDNRVRVANNQPFWKGAENTNQDNPLMAKTFILKVSGNGYSDESMIGFLQDASSGFDRDYDAYKLLSPEETAPQINAKTLDGSNTSVAVNFLPSDLEKQVTVPIEFTVGVAGTYTITTNNAFYDYSVKVTLEDVKTGKMTDLQNATYTFKSEAVTNDNRFLIHFGASPTSVKESNLTDMINIYTDKNQIVVQNKSNINQQGTITVYDVLGKEITSRNLASNSETRLEMSSQVQAIYFVKIMTNIQSVTKKVIILK